MHTAILAGASQDIGKGIALALLVEGIRVIDLSRSAEKLASLAAKAGPGAPLVTEPLDVAEYGVRCNEGSPGATAARSWGCARSALCRSECPTPISSRKSDRNLQRFRHGVFENSALPDDR